MKIPDTICTPVSSMRTRSTIVLTTLYLWSVAPRSRSFSLTKNKIIQTSPTMSAGSRFGPAPVTNSEFTRPIRDEFRSMVTAALQLCLLESIISLASWKVQTSAYGSWHGFRLSIGFLNTWQDLVFAFFIVWQNLVFVFISSLCCLDWISSSQYHFLDRRRSSSVSLRRYLVLIDLTFAHFVVLVVFTSFFSLFNSHWFCWALADSVFNNLAWWRFTWQESSVLLVFLVFWTDLVRRRRRRARSIVVVVTSDVTGACWGMHASVRWRCKVVCLRTIQSIQMIIIVFALLFVLPFLSS